MTYVLATAAAVANALTSILQRAAARTAPEDSTFSLQLLRYLLRRKVWFFGLLAMMAGFLLQAAALHYGELSTVQPIMVAELVFTLAILYLWFHAPIGRVEWTGALLIVVGLASFLYAAQAKPGHMVPSTVEWLAAAAATAAVAGVAILLARTGSKARKAALFGTAAAVIWAFTAALTKTMTALVPRGFVALFTHWPIYAVVGVGIIGLVVVQSAFQAGPLAASQPALIIVDPLASIFIGIFLFGDRLHGGPHHILIDVVGLIVMVIGVLVLHRSPLILGTTDEDLEAPGRRGRSHGSAPEAGAGATPWDAEKSSPVPFESGTGPVGCN